MSTITDKVEIERKLHELLDRQVTVYLDFGPYIELGITSKLSRGMTGRWRVMTSIAGAATGLLFTAHGVESIRIGKDAEGIDQLHICLESPGEAASPQEFT